MKKRMRRLIVSLAVLGLTVAVQLILSANRNQILINSGASLYRTLNVLAKVLLGVGIAFFAFSAVSLLLQVITAARKQPAAPAAVRPAANAPLSLKNGAYDEGVIRQLLAEHLKRASDSEVQLALLEFKGQLDRMNTYQAQLGQMLRQNGAEDMGEAEGFLDKLEQNMFGVMRQVFNLLTMQDRSKDTGPLLNKLSAAKAHNDEVLEQAGRLCAAMTDYINEQESPESTFTSVEMFINALETVPL